MAPGTASLRTRGRRAGSQSLWLEALGNLRRNPSAIAGMLVIGLLILVALAAPLVATHDPILSMIGQSGETGRLQAKAPCIPLLGCEGTLHYMGLDLNARDLYSRVIFGTRTSLSVGVITISLSIVTGTLLGLVAGYAGGRTEDVIMRLMDVVMAFPALLLAISIVTILGPGLTNALLGITITFIPQYARLMRASVLSLKEQEFVTAEQAVGAGPLRIIFAHILPNAVTPIIVQGTLGIGTAILDAAALSFLGLGAQPPTPEWGQILSESRNYVFTSPHLVFFPGIAIMVTVLGFNLLGDGMRDALDPRLNRN
ncbi:MAG: ABC transporter permease [Anaerolineaceae bacterium]|nr:ABC transporter permease [Anaerolineaceae bacterium]